MLHQQAYQREKQQALTFQELDTTNNMLHQPNNAASAKQCCISQTMLHEQPR
jgi:hypothetical protein